MHDDGLIRRIGPIFDSGRLGYTSTLVAAQVPEERLDDVAEMVSALPGVTHNYRREHAFNLWFTLTVDAPGKIESTLEDLRRRTRIREFYSLPALAVYKTRVNFHLSGDVPEPASPEARRHDRRRAGRPAAEGTGAPAAGGPAAGAGAVRGARPADGLVRSARSSGRCRTGWSAASSGASARWCATGGWASSGNGMAAFRVSPVRVDAVGRSLAQYGEISHCYRRPPVPGWDYNLFAMVHGRSEDEVREFVARIAVEHELPDHAILFSTTEYKKTSMKYFLEAADARAGLEVRTTP